MERLPEVSINPTPEQRRFAELIEDLLNTSGLTVGALAERIGVYRGTVNNWIGKGTKWVDIERMTIANLEAIAHMKGCTVDELMMIVRDDEPKSSNPSLVAAKLQGRVSYHLGEAQRLVRQLQLSNPLTIDVAVLRTIASRCLEMAGYSLDSTEGLQVIATTVGPHVLPLERVQQIMVGCDVSHSNLIHLARVFRVLSQSNSPTAEELY